MAKHRNKVDEKFNTPKEAVAAAHAFFPPNADWRQHFKNDEFKSAEDLQAFILFNMLRNLLDLLDQSNEMLYLSTIQSNMLYSSFKFK